MDILIKNMEMPQEGHIEAYIWCNGTVTYRKKIDNQWDRNSTTAVALPEHGRLISDTDVKALLHSGLSLDTDSDIDHVCGLIDGLPTIVEASE